MSRINHAADLRPKRVAVVVEDIDGTVTTYSAEGPESAIVEIERDALPAEPDGDWARFWPSPLAHFDLRVVARSIGREIRPPAPHEAANAAAEPDPRPAASAHEAHCKGWHSALGSCPAPADEAPSAEAVLSETSEPYVSVSVSANDADELAKLLRKLIREKGAKSFGLAAAP